MPMNLLIERCRSDFFKEISTELLSALLNLINSDSSLMLQQDTYIYY